MELKEQVCDLKYAKELKELGVKQDSLWYWRVEIDDGEEYPEIWRDNFNTKIGLKKYSAFSTSELGSMLPHKVGGVSVGLNPLVAYLNITKPSNWFVSYGKGKLRGEQDGYPLQDESDSNLANAMAKMLIYLIKEKL